MTTEVAVIIPFYQREKGFLRRALDSVAAQELPDDVRLRIVVVDDESPLPVEAALEGFAPPPPHELVVLRRPNGGPGAARNTGLDHLRSGSTDFVAFLDSDDVWFEEHLARALEALRAGADFYFSNSVHDETDSFFYTLYIKRHHVRAADGTYRPEARTIGSAEAFDAIVEECIPHTSQSVYDFRKHPDLRFDETLRRAGEDHLFWITLSHRSERVTYSTAQMGSRDRGISIYRETLSWDSLEGPNRLMDEMLFRKEVLSRFSMGEDKRRALRRALQAKRDHLLFLMLRNLKYRPRLTVDALRRLRAVAPDFFLHAPRTVLNLPAHVMRLRAEGRSS